MSIIQQIRDRAAVLLTGLIALSLIGFLVQDAFIGKSSGALTSRTTTVGSINGRKIDAIEFNSKVNMAEQGYRSQGMQTSEMMTQNIIESIWIGYIQESLVRSEADKLCLSLTSKELGSLLFSEKAPQEFKQLFTDPNTGQFDAGRKEWFNNLKKSKNLKILKW
jgi:peptidyl-prolyl cis-trans isomerase D